VARKRSAVGLVQQELATRVGISRQSLSAVEAGGAVPSATVALRLAKALNCAVEELFWTDDEPAVVEAELTFVPAPPPTSRTGRDRGTAGNRVLLGFLSDRWVAHELDPASDGAFTTSADGVLRGPGKKTSEGRATAKVSLLGDELGARQNLLCAGCAPAFGLLAARASRGPGARDRVVWLERPSGEALGLLARRRIHVAGAHIYDAGTGEFNVPAVQRLFADRSMRVFTLARWEVGLVVAPGNPLRIRGVADLVRRDVRFVRRQDSAAAQDLVVRLAGREGIPLGRLSEANLVARGHSEVARLVALGAADVGVAVATVAHAHGLGFLPLEQERFDIVVNKEGSVDPRVARLLETLSSQSFRREMESLGGHVTRDAGKLVAET